MEWPKEGPEGSNGGGHQRVFEGCFSEDVGNDGVKGWVRVFGWGEVEEAGRDDGNEPVGALD